MTKAAEYLNISQTTTAAYSPNMSGTNERNHCIVDWMIEKIMFQDPTLTDKVALCYPLAAKNSLETYQGFSPAQLVFGGIYFKNKTKRWEGPVKVDARDGQLLYDFRAGSLLTINLDHTVLSKQEGEVVARQNEKRNDDAPNTQNLDNSEFRRSVSTPPPAAPELTEASLRETSRNSSQDTLEMVQRTS